MVNTRLCYKCEHIRVSQLPRALVFIGTTLILPRKRVFKFSCQIQSTHDSTHTNTFTLFPLALEFRKTDRGNFPDSSVSTYIPSSFNDYN